MPAARAHHGLIPLLLAVAPLASGAGCPGNTDFPSQAAPRLRAQGADAKGGGSTGIAWTELIPMVILPTRPAGDPVVLRAQTSGPLPQSLQLQLDGGGTLALLDNGVAPDATAGDGIFSVNLATPEILQRNVPARYGRPILGQLRPVVGGMAVSPAINIVGDVAPADLPAYPIVFRIGNPTYKYTSHVVNYIDDAFHQNQVIEATTTRILPSLGDHYDFVDLLAVPRRYVANRFHGAVRNATTGIGQNVFDAGAAFGSPARLKGFTMFPTIGFYDPQDRGYNHELGHQWINHLLGALDDTTGAHWPVGALAQDVMGTSGGGGQGIELGCALTRSGQTVNGTPQANRRLFGPWELYLMGLVPPSAVPASFQFTDQAAARQRIVQPNWCTSNIPLAATTIDLQTIIGANGVRSPDSTQSQRYFTLATLAVSAGRLLDDTELRYLTWLARRGESDESLMTAIGLATAPGFNFHAATGGRARVDSRLDALFRDRFE